MAARKSHKPMMGEISSGTCNPADLLRKFADELQWIAPRGNFGLVTEAYKMADMLDLPETITGPDLAYEIINDLENALNEYAPDYLYFGSNEGDGASYGWWPTMDEIDELPAFDDTGAARDARHVGDFRVVSDHGNVEIYRRGGNGRITSILGIV
jgi:hypothetical protein